MSELGKRIDARERVLGLDLGSRRIGVAISDSKLTLAVPLSIIRRGALADDFAALDELVASKRIGALVVGWPVHMSGKMSPRARATRSFVASYVRHGFRGPTVLWDERLSSAAVEVMTKRPATSRKPVPKPTSASDDAAATWILQGALESLHAGGDLRLTR